MKRTIIAAAFFATASASAADAPTVPVAMTVDEMNGVFNAYTIAMEACGTATLPTCVQMRISHDSVVAKLVAAYKSTQVKK